MCEMFILQPRPVPDFKFIGVYKKWHLGVLTGTNEHMVLSLPIGPVRFLLIATRMPVASKP
jgi:hypothetical protein